MSQAHKKSVNFYTKLVSAFFLIMMWSLSYWLYSKIGNIKHLDETTKNEMIAACWGFFALGFYGPISRRFLRQWITTTLRPMTVKLKEDAHQLEKFSQNLSTASTSLATNTERQATALQQTAASLEQIQSMVAKNADSAVKSQGVVNNSREAAAHSQEAVAEMVKALEEINQSQDHIINEVELGNQQIAGIVKVISEIGEKTKVINDIVFQTKLLSFNASVEAARAGEHGKGFSVVAQEIGNLAHMSGGAAKEISTLLDSSIKRVEDIISATAGKVSSLVGEGRNKMNHGGELARRCEQALNQLVAEFQSVTQIVGEISIANQEQAKGTAEINKAMQQLDQTTNQNNVSTKQTSQGATDVLQRAKNLRETLYDLESKLSLGHEGDDFAQQSSPPVKTEAKVLKLQSATATTKSTPVTAPHVPVKAKSVVKVHAKIEKPKVTPIRSAKNVPAPMKKPEPAVHSEKKLVSGMDIPLESDPRFEDV